MMVDANALTLFKRILASYLIILMLGVGLSVTVHLTAFRIAARQARASQLQALRHSGRAMDLYLDELDSMARRIAGSRRYRALLSVSVTDRAARPIRAYEMWDELRFGLINSGVVDDAYIAVPHLNLVVSLDRIMLDPQRHYGALFGATNLSYDEWSELFSTWGGRRQVIPSTAWFSDTGVIQAIAYARQFPLDHSAVSVGGVLFLTAAESIHSLFLHEGPLASTVAVVSSDGRIVTGIGDTRALEALAEIGAAEVASGASGSLDRRLGGVDSIVTYDVSSRGDLVYVAALPVSEVFATIRPIRNAALGLILAYIATGVAIGFMLARINTKPYSELIAANARLANIVHETQPYIRASVLNRLLRGELEREQEVDPSLTELGLPHSEAGYRIIVASVLGHRAEGWGSRAASLRRRRNALLRVVQEHAPATDLVFSLGGEAVYVLHALRGADADDRLTMVELANHVRTRARAAHMHVVVGVGEPVPALVDLKRSFDTATEVAEYAELSGTHQLTFRSDLPLLSHDACYYPHELQLRIERSVQAGDVDRVKQAIDELREMNLSRPGTNASMIRQLLYELRGTYLRAVSGRMHPPSLSRLRQRAESFFAPEYDSRPPEFDVLAHALEDAAAAVHDQKRSHNEVLKERIIRFVDHSITNPNLCVAFAAAEHGLSEDYYSRFFHEQIGETFSHYVELKRLDLAEQMLRSTGRPVEAVATECGFGSVRTLRRAFRRRFGITPSEVRAVPGTR